MIEQYFIPRFEVIANYPDSPFCIHQIVSLDKKTKDGKYWHEFTPKEPIHLEEEATLLYPAIFKKLEWFEGWHNKMPEYLSVNGVIKKVKNYGNYKGGESAMFEDGSTTYLSHTLPSLSPTQGVSTK